MTVSAYKRAPMKKIFIVAAEPSGDLIGARFIRALDKNIDVVGVGGVAMNAVCAAIAPLEHMAVMGFVEVITKLHKILPTLCRIVRSIEEAHPDVVVFVDSPGLSLWVARRIRKSVPKIVQYVSPTIWAYKPSRLNRMIGLYDLVLCILPFEPKYYENSGINARYVGHPVTELDWSVKSRMFEHESDVFGVMVGSREQEIETLAPIFIRAMNLCVATRTIDPLVVFALSSEASRAILQKFEVDIRFRFVVRVCHSDEERVALFKSLDRAITKSGTVTHELAAAGVPMIVAHKVHWFTAFLLERVFHIGRFIQHLSLVNILLDKEVVPEFIQSECNSECLAKSIAMLYEPTFVTKQKRALSQAIQMLKSPESGLTPSQLASEYIMKWSDGPRHRNNLRPTR